MTTPHRALVSAVQSSLERRYDLSLPCPVDGFVCHDSHWLAQATGSTADTDEVLLVRQQDNTLDVTLYLDDTVLPRADAALQSGQLDDHGLDAVCTVLEGVSHVVCVLWHAHHQRQVRALDLELQADVDKFVLLVRTQADADGRRTLHRRLFDGMSIAAPVRTALHERYRTAHHHAAGYCQWLNTRYMDPRDEQGLAGELARFYRLSGPDKRRHIQRLH